MTEQSQSQQEETNESQQEETSERGGLTGLLEELPTDRLVQAGQALMGSLGQRAMSSVSDTVEQTTERLADYAENGGPGLRAALTGAQSLAQGESPLKAALSSGWSQVKDKAQQALGGGSGGGGGGGGKMKFTNIVEDIDVGVPVRVAYNQWTQFQDFPEILKKVEQADAESDDEDEQKLNWKAQVLWSHRSWEATITEQVPDKQIVWESTGQKGYVDGSVTFHELAPNLTRILVVLVYHQTGFVEGVANTWRAAGRRARLELKHFRRHVMTQTILNPDEVEGWRGEIHEGEVVKTHEQALQEEQEEQGEGEGEGEEQPAEQEQPAEGEQDQSEYAAQDEYEQEGAYEEGEYEQEGEYQEYEEEEEPRERETTSA